MIAPCSGPFGLGLFVLAEEQNRETGGVKREG